MIGQQLDFQQLFAERVPRRVFANLGHPLGHVPLEQPALDQLLGVRIHGNIAAQTIRSGHAVDKPPHVVDRLAGQRGQRVDQPGGGTLRELQMERDLFAVEDVDEGLAIAIGLAAHRRRKTLPEAVQHIKDVLAGTEGIGAKIGQEQYDCPRSSPRNATR